MLHMKYFFLPISSTSFVKKKADESQKTIEDFLNELGEEKIVQVVCGITQYGTAMYTVFYRD